MMKNVMARRIVNTVFVLVLHIPLSFVSGLVTIGLMERYFSASLLTILMLPVDLVISLVNFLLAYLLTAAISREKISMKRGILGALCFMGVDTVLPIVGAAIVALVLPGASQNMIVLFLLNYVPLIVGAFVAGLISFPEPKAAPVYGAPYPYQVPCGVQPPYPQAPYAAPEVPAEDGTQDT